MQGHEAHVDLRSEIARFRCLANPLVRLFAILPNTSTEQKAFPIFPHRSDAAAIGGL
jgi:hypothetical protein